MTLSLRLPESAAREVLDFVEFLEQRYASAAPTTASSQADEQTRREALAHIAQLRVHWRGKPVPDRNALYDDARS